MKSLLLFFWLTLALTHTESYSQQSEIDSTVVVNRDYLTSDPVDMRYITKDSVLMVGENYYVRQIPIFKSPNDVQIANNISDRQIFSTPGHFKSISKLGDIVYIAGDNGKIVRYRSLQNYDTINTNLNITITDIEVCGNTIYFVDDEKQVYATKDFEEIVSADIEENANDIYYQDGNIYLACNNGIAYLSKDNGKTWEKKLIDEGKDLLSVKGNSTNIFFSGYTLAISNMDLTEIFTSKTDFNALNILYIKDFNVLSDSLAIAGLVEIGSSAYLVKYNILEDSISNLSYLSYYEPLISFSEQFNKAVFWKSRLFFKEYTLENIDLPIDNGIQRCLEPNYNKVSDIHLIDNHKLIGLFKNDRGTYQANFSKNGEILDTLSAFYINPDADTIGVVDLNYVRTENKTFAVIDSVVASTDKKISGKSVLISSDHNLKEWEEHGQSALNFYQLQYNKWNDILSYAESNSTYKFSTDEGDSWNELPMPEDYGWTDVLKALDEKTFVVRPFNISDPNSPVTIKTTDGGESWYELDWYPNHDTLSIAKVSGFYAPVFYYTKEMSLFWDDANRVLYKSTDGLETWDKLVSLPSISSIVYNSFHERNGAFYLLTSNHLLKFENNFSQIDSIPLQIAKLHIPAGAARRVTSVISHCLID